jgi:hypothetical protein
MSNITSSIPIAFLIAASAGAHGIVVDEQTDIASLASELLTQHQQGTAKSAAESDNTSNSKMAQGYGCISGYWRRC